MLNLFHRIFKATTYTPVFSACLLVCAFLGQARAAQTKQPPNIVILFADDLGYGELGFQGNKQIPTPHIDSIAKNGVRFTNGYVTASVCSPSRAGLLSGRYQARFNYHTNVMPHTIEGSDLGIPASEITLAELLKKAGYRTGIIGKWHLGSRADFNPTRHGFDYFYGFAHEGRYFVRPPWAGVTTLLRKKVLPDGKTGRWSRPDGKLLYHDILGNEPLYDLNNPIYRNTKVVQEKRYLTDAFTDEAVQFIERNKSQPFFLYLAYNAVHSPLQGADAYMAKMSHIKDIHRRIFGAAVDLEVTLQALSKVKTKNGEFHKAMTARANRAHRKVNEILSVANLPGLAAAVKKLPESFNSTTVVNPKMIDQLAQAAGMDSLPGVQFGRQTHCFGKC
jgi:hypothetical protein